MKLSAEGKLRLAVQLAFIAGAGTVAGGAYAQDSGDAKSTQLQGVQVTGSRIKQPNLTSSSSMTVISDKELQYQGTTNVETLLNSLPQTFAGFGTTDSNGATGTATVDLRGLGPQETLVLIDGKRLMPGDPVQSPPSADLNFIPAALVDRIDILSGGASAVYGSDAVAGVVNFVMKKDFQGFRVDTQFSRTDHSDGSTYDTTLVWGSNFNGGKGNVTMFAGYTKMDGITEDRRGFSSCAFNTSATGHVCAGSGVTQQGRFISYDRYYAGKGPLYSVIQSGQGATPRTIVDNDTTTFNFAPYNYLQRPAGRYNLGGFAHDQINKHIDLYGSAMFMDNHTVAQVAPSGAFGTVASVPCNSPLLSAEETDYLCTQAGLDKDTGVATLAVLRRTTEVGPRDDDLRHEQFRIVIGARGDIADGWAYDVSGQRGEVDYTHKYLGYTDSNKIVNALNVIKGPATLANGSANPLSGQAECQVTYDGKDPNCVPLDVFALNSITPAAAKYITGFGEATASQVEQVLTSSVTGDLGKYGVKSPFAKNGVGLATGWEYRTESLDYSPDNVIAAGDLGGLGGPSPAVTGAFQVNEAFGEMQVPLIENMPFVKLFQVDGAYRWSNYSLANDAHSYKGAMQYKPTDDLLVRASFQRATRAPSVSELFLPQAFGLVGGTDPCGTTTNPDGTINPPSLSQAQCANTGMTATQYGKTGQCLAGQCNVKTGGNQDLKPELSITRSAGLVITPRIVKNLSITLDYFDITIRGPISTLPFNAILQQCAITGDPTLCGAVHRGPTGALSGSTDNGNFVDNTNINTGMQRTKGFDTQWDYRIRLRDLGLGNHGQFVFNYAATYLFNYSAEAGPGLGVYECVARFGVTCGTPNPRYRHKLRATWDSPFGLSVSGDWRYFGQVYLDSNTNDPNLTNHAHDKVDGTFSSKQYFDLSAAYTLPLTGENITFRAGISNLFGQAPPLANQTIASPPFGNANTFPAVYDSLGRVMFVGLTADF